MRHIVGVLLSVKWNAERDGHVLTSKEYIDTVFVPLVPITFEGDE